MKRQSGFTLIELIIVIVILGILAVTAAPQFFNFGADARASTVRGMEGSVKAAADLVYSRAAVRGLERAPASEEESVSVSGSGDGNILIAFGYPTAATLQNALNVSQNDWVFDGDGTTVIIRPAGISAGAAPVEDEDPDTRCHVSYTQPSAPDTRPQIEAFTNGS